MRLIVMVGLPGSGKSTYILKNLSDFVHINQDALGSRKACEQALRKALAAGKDAVIDRTNTSTAQRRTWVSIGLEYGADVSAVVMDTPVKECVERILQRNNHPTITTKDDFEASAIVGRHAVEMAPPTVFEGFTKITRVRN